MQALHNRSKRPGRGWRSPWLAVPVVVLLAAAGGIAYATTSAGQKSPVTCQKGVSCSTTSTTGPATDAAAKTMTVDSTTPATGATGVQPNAGVVIKFSTKVAAHSVTPTISPQVTGTWSHSGDELVFTPDQSLVPFTKYTVTIPGGTSGVSATDGAHLNGSKTETFTVASGSVLRLQQLLAELGYLPLSYSAATASPRDMALAQTGTLVWRWSGLPSELTGQWVAGETNVITKGAVMTFETENGLTVDGVAGPEVWATLLQDAASDKTNSEPVSYVLVTKELPEHLTVWVNGTLTFNAVPVNTGVPGATTVDGTFQVFEHVQKSDMKGTDVTGTQYTDPDIPWVSYFHGGQALHGYPRASYGFPQSNGCVEMRITTAAKVWPDTPIGTLVTVQGPTSKVASSKASITSPGPAPATSTSTAPTTSAPTTTTTAPATGATTTTTAPPAAG